MCGVKGCKQPVNRDGVCFRHKILSTSTHGIRQFRLQSDFGKTEREMTRENVTAFKEKHGYYPDKVKGEQT